MGPKNFVARLSGHFRLLSIHLHKKFARPSVLNVQDSRLTTHHASLSDLYHISLTKNKIEPLGKSRAVWYMFVLFVYIHCVPLFLC